MSLTKSDLKQIANIFDIKFDEKFDKLRNEFQNWKSEFYAKIDPILKEVQVSLEEREVMNQQISDNTDRIEKLEEKVLQP